MLWFILFFAVFGAWLAYEIRALGRMGTQKSEEAAKYAMPWRAISYAPLANIPVTSFLGYDVYEKTLTGVGKGLFVAVVFFTPMFYVGFVIFGLPIYFLLLRLNLLNVWTLCLPVALISFALLTGEVPGLVICILVASAVVVSAAAYFLRPRMTGLP
ncbi:hypothetical protein GJ698_09130 [Pseudoduganella sp. FT26W]|uniref:Uncharacterized protein n=1 Tax=Duganella aquatilis TaxID=2666082 RepID=A0A844DAR3_9BURK|nr:hypothetical protein [Duganella aquatilis]MRW84254.1 hypothetical protein [Duganella aquatilis]